jgi:hypothetical protein
VVPAARVGASGPACSQLLYRGVSGRRRDGGRERG